MFEKMPKLSAEGLIHIAVIVLVTAVAAQVAVRSIQLYARKRRHVLPSTSIFINLVRVGVFVVGGLMVLQTLGISITPVLTAVGVGGLAVALGLQETLSNFFSGLQIVASGLVKNGDYIRLSSGEEGYVQDITWRNTTIRALANNMIVIPNSKLAASVLTNYNQPQREMAVLVPVGVSYDSDLEKVERVTVEVAKEVMQTVPGGIPEFDPFIRYHSFGDSSIGFNVILRGREFGEQYLVKHEFIKRLLARYRKEGIEIPFPVRNVYMRQMPS